MITEGGVLWLRGLFLMFSMALCVCDADINVCVCVCAEVRRTGSCQGVQRDELQPPSWGPDERVWDAEEAQPQHYCQAVRCGRGEAATRRGQTTAGTKEEDRFGHGGRQNSIIFQYYYAFLWNQSKTSLSPQACWINICLNPHPKGTVKSIRMLQTFAFCSLLICVS